MYISFSPSPIPSCYWPLDCSSNPNYVLFHCGSVVMFVRLVTIVLFLWFRKKHGIFDILNSILPENQRKFFKTHKIGIIPGKTGGVRFLCKCHAVIEIINSVWVSSRKYTLWQKIILDSAYTKYITFILSHTRYQQVRQRANGAIL